VDIATLVKTVKFSQEELKMENPLSRGLVSKPRVLTQIRRVPPQAYRWMILSTNWWKALVHWAPGERRSLPCLKDKMRCPGHALNLPVKELAWLHVLCINLKEMCFLELPHHAAWELGQMLSPYENIRGCVFETRRNGGKGGRVLFEPADPWPAATVLTYPAPQDPFDTLKELWNMNEVHMKIRSASDLDTDLGAA
jgi:hypothetical protein